MFDRNLIAAVLLLLLPTFSFGADRDVTPPYIVHVKIAEKGKVEVGFKKDGDSLIFDSYHPTISNYMESLEYRGPFDEDHIARINALVENTENTIQYIAVEDLTASKMAEVKVETSVQTWLSERLSEDCFKPWRLRALPLYRIKSRSKVIDIENLPDLYFPKIPELGEEWKMYAGLSAFLYVLYNMPEFKRAVDGKEIWGKLLEFWKKYGPPCNFARTSELVHGNIARVLFQWELEIGERRVVTNRDTIPPNMTIWKPEEYRILDLPPYLILGQASGYRLKKYFDLSIQF